MAVTVGTFAAYAFVGYLVGRLANDLLGGDEDKSTLQDSRPRTMSERGSWIPLLIGRDRLGANYGPVFGHFTTLESAPGGGGKGFGGGGSASSPQQLVHWESGWHRVCVGGGKGVIHRIFKDGVQAYKPEFPLSSDEADPGYIPSGGSVVVPEMGTMRIFWGNDNQPSIPELITPEGIGVSSSWPWTMSIVWTDMRLGGFWTWPLVEYDIEIHPYREVEGFDRITGVSDWFQSGLGLEGDPLPITAFFDDQDSAESLNPGELKLYLAGNSEALFNDADEARISGQNDFVSNKDYPILSATHEAVATFFGHNFVYPEYTIRTNSFGTTVHEYRIDTNPSMLLRWFTRTFTEDPILHSPPGIGSIPDTPPGIPTKFWNFTEPGVIGINDQWNTYKVTELNTEPLDHIQPGMITHRMVDEHLDPRAPNGALLFHPELAYVGRAVSYISMYACGFGEDNQLGAEVCEFFELFITGGWDTASPEKHSTRFEWNGGGFNIINLNGSKGSVVSAGNDPITGVTWYKFTIKYANGTGQDPTTGTNRVEWGMEWGNSNPLGHRDCKIFIFFEVWWWIVNHELGGSTFYSDNRVQYYDHSNVSSASRTVVTLQGIGAEDVFWSEGQIEILSEAAGLTGCNAISVIHQLLFAPYPHGAGQDATKWDMDSFVTTGQKVGELTDGEALRTHVLFENGDSVISILTNILTDLSCMVLQDPKTGLYILRLIREVDPADIISISERNILDPKPELISRHDPKSPSRITYTYTDAQLDYRENTVTADDDGQAASFPGQLQKQVDLTIARDKTVARKIAQRRRQEDMETPNATEYSLSRSARDLMPGDVIQEFGSTDSHLILDLKRETDTSRISVNTVADIYGVSDPTISDDETSNLIYAGPDSEEPSEDLFVGIFEAPFLSGSLDPRVEVVRIRASRNIIGAETWASTDGSSYARLEGESPYVGGGILTRYMDADEMLGVEENGPMITLLGEDLPFIVQTLSKDQFYQGRQLMRIDDELFYVREFTAVATGVYQAVGIHRGVLGSELTAHNVGSVVMVYPQGRPTSYTGPQFRGDEVYFKVLPKIGINALSLDAATAQLKPLIHPHLIPLPVVNLSANNGTNDYSDGDDVDLIFNFRLPEAIRNLDSAGSQVAGAVSPVGSYSNYMLNVEGLYLGTILILSYYDQQLQSSFTIPYADILAAFGSPRRPFYVDVWISGLRDSTKERIYITYS